MLLKCPLRPHQDVHLHLHLHTLKNGGPPRLFSTSWPSLLCSTKLVLSRVRRASALLPSISSAMSLRGPCILFSLWINTLELGAEYSDAVALDVGTRFRRIGMPDRRVVHSGLPRTPLGACCSTALNVQDIQERSHGRVLIFLST